MERNPPRELHRKKQEKSELPSSNFSSHYYDAAAFANMNSQAALLLV